MTTVRPLLKRLHSPDLYDLEKPSLNPGEPFCILVQAMFGPDNSEGEESFDLLVCNLKWIERKLTQGPLSGRHHLIVSKFDASDIRRYLENQALHCSGSTWAEVAGKLGRIGRWEFEDYR